MPSNFNARRLVESLIGETLFTPTHGKPNVVLGIAGANAVIGTERSPAGETVALTKIQEGLDKLEEDGEVRITPDSFGAYRRSSAIGALLTTVPYTEVTEPPTYVRLASSSPLRTHLEGACELIQAKRTEDRVVPDDQLYELMVRQLPETVRKHVPDVATYKVQGSAGQRNLTWAETPWLGIFDRLVTDSAQRGHYLVYLIHPRGEGVFLSLNQGITEARQKGRRGRLNAYLSSRAARLRSYLEEGEVENLISEPIDLDGRTLRTQAYQAANVVAFHYPAAHIPHDAVLVSQLHQALELYEKVTAALDEDEAIEDANAPDAATEGAESKRYRWHKRAEGRNSAVARNAKRLHGPVCRACGRNFAEELGELGKACLDAHHLSPFSELDSRPRRLDPLKDFAVVCANCHRMLHTETPPLSPEQLKAKLT